MRQLCIKKDKKVKIEIGRNWQKESIKGKEGNAKNTITRPDTGHKMRSRLY